MATKRKPKKVTRKPYREPYARFVTTVTVSDVSRRLDNLDSVCRRELERLHQAVQSTQRRLDQTVLLLHAQAPRAILRCTVCKKAEPDVKFTYETENGQLCESCWVWHQSVKETLSPKAKVGDVITVKV